jgi:hypothetical protein
MPAIAPNSSLGRPGYGYEGLWNTTDGVNPTYHYNLTLPALNSFELDVLLDTGPEGLSSDQLALLCLRLRESEQFCAAIASLLFRKPELLESPEDRAAVIQSFRSHKRQPALSRLLAEWTESTLKDQRFQYDPQVKGVALAFLDDVPRSHRQNLSIAKLTLDWWRENPHVINPYIELGVKQPTQRFIATLEEIASHSFTQSMSEKKWRTLYDLCTATLVGKSCAGLLNPIIALGGQPAAAPFFWLTLSGILFFALNEDHKRASQCDETGPIQISFAESQAIASLVEIEQQANVTSPGLVIALRSWFIRGCTKIALDRIASGLGTSKKMVTIHRNSAPSN